MLFNLVVLLVILAATAYFATQGLLTATLVFITSTFASILALGLFEPLQGTIEGHWPSLARGLTFLSLYVVIFLALRFGADFAVPKNIKLPKMIDNVAGGLMGLFASLVIVGSSILGMEMLPVHTTILAVGGDQEYWTDARMQGEQQGQVNPDNGISMWPQRFVLAMMDGASGRSLGGSKSFVDVHPDLPMESYGYRNVVQYGSNPAVPQELLDISKFKVESYLSSAEDLLKKCNISEGKQALVVRIRVKKGTTTPIVSFDIGNEGQAADSPPAFRITPTEVRVVTDKEQHYPIGHLRNESITDPQTHATGTAYVFEATPLDTGHLIDDYVKEVVIEDWVFELDKDEKPQFLEVKELARAEFPEKVSIKPFAQLAAADYPHREYRKNHGSVAVTLQGDAGPLKDVKLMLVPSNVQKKEIESAMDSANSHIEKVLDDESGGPWAAAFGKPGVPGMYAFKTAHNTVTNANILTVMQWGQLVPVLMLGTVETDGDRNLNVALTRFHDTVEPLLKDIRVTGVTDVNGKVTLEDVAPGDYCVIGAAKTDSGNFYAWASSVSVQKKTQAEVNLKPGDASFSLTVK